ncbi:MAG: SBBP repeat-containing protein [bacterium]
MKIFTILLVISFSILLSSQFSQAQVIREWVKHYNSGSNDFITSSVIDDSGNVYVTGWTNGAGTGYDVTTIKYNSAGTQLWLKSYNGQANGDDFGSKISIDSGYIYVAGNSIGVGTSNDYLIIKYKSNGDTLWVRKYNGTANGVDAITDMVFDTPGNIYVTGYAANTGTGSSDYTTVKFTSNGDQLWVRNYNGSGNGEDVATSITIDGSNNIYITGYSLGSTSNYDYATLKYSSNGGLLWTRRYNGLGNGSDGSRGISIDSSGNIYITGESAGSGTGNDYVTIKYNSSGDSLWVRRYNLSGSSSDNATSIKASPSGNVYVTGYSSSDYATLKYNTNGDLMWTQRYNVGNNDQAYFLNIDQLENIYVTGTVGSTNPFNSYDIGTVKYNSVGNLIWVDRYFGGSSPDYNSFGVTIIIKGLHFVYVAGGRRVNYNTDFVTIKYFQPFIGKVLIEGFYDPVSNTLVRDTVRVYLRNTTSPYTPVDSAKIFTDNQGSGNYSFSNPVPGEYYLVVKHRNSIETWSPAIFPFQTMNYDFTTAANKAYGSNQILKGTKYCIYSGDVNQDCIIDLVDLGEVDNDAFNGTGGYIQSDLNGDFFVDLSDLAIVDNNAYNFVSCVKP